MDQRNRFARFAMLRPVPPAPEVVARLYEDFTRIAKPHGIGFKQYLGMSGYTNPADSVFGMDDGLVQSEPFAASSLIGIPQTEVRGTLKVKVLLVDFTDLQAVQSAARFEELLFSKGNQSTRSMRDYYREVTLDKVDVVGSVHGWFRMPRSYASYTNGQSGMGPNSYPNNAQKMAEDAVKAALASGVVFEPELDNFGTGFVTALFIVHAGPGAEVLDPAARGAHIWSHKWGMADPVPVGNSKSAHVYLTVPEDCRLGVCAHELGHLVFQWDDFYDPNYNDDGVEWDGSGNWDLMAGGSYNGSGRTPAHPAALHKHQHRWVMIEEVSASRAVTVEPYTPTSGKIVKIRGPHYSPKQYLLLENRTRTGFDSALPGQGLLVWRVDERLKMTSPASPAMLLIQADGRHDLERADDYNAGDDGDPFPGQAGRTFLGDTGDISTTFPGGDRSEVALKNIRHDPISNSIQLDVEIGATESVVSELDTIYKRIEVNTAIPDNNAAGISSPLRIEENGIVRGIQVAVDISHTYIGDLKVELISPSGEWAVLHDHMGGGAKNLATAYSSENHAALAALTGNPVKGDWVLHVSDDVVHDTGKLNHWAIQIFRSEIRNDNRIQVESAPALAIPDNDPGGAGDAISISRAGTVRDLLVKIKVTHSYIGDLLIELIGPRGDRAILHNKAGSNSKNIDKTYTLTDQSALGAFVGSPTQGNWVLWASDHAARDIGKLDRWSLDIGLGAGSQVARGDANVDVEIPDNLPAGIASAIHIAETGSAQSVRVGVVIHHGYVGDLRVELVAPDGDRALLHNRGVQSAENLVRSYDSVNHLELGKLRGKAIRGNWFLRVTDTAYRDVGRLISWSIQLPYTA